MIIFSYHDPVLSFTSHMNINNEPVTERTGRLERQLETVPSCAWTALV